MLEAGAVSAAIVTLLFPVAGRAQTARYSTGQPKPTAIASADWLRGGAGADRLRGGRRRTEICRGGSGDDRLAGCE